MAAGCSFLLTLLDWGDSVSLVFSPLYDYEDFDDDDDDDDDENCDDDDDGDEANDGDANKSQRQRQKLHSGFRETKTYF